MVQTLRRFGGIGMARLGVLHTIGVAALALVFPAQAQVQQGPADQRLVAYVEAPMPDGVDRLCFAYLPHSGQTVSHWPVTGAYPILEASYQFIDYTVDPGGKTLTVTGLYSSKPWLKPGSVSITAQIYADPAKSPCSPQSWPRMGFLPSDTGTTAPIEGATLSPPASDASRVRGQADPELDQDFSQAPEDDEGWCMEHTHSASALNRCWAVQHHEKQLTPEDVERYGPHIVIRPPPVPPKGSCIEYNGSLICR